MKLKFKVQPYQTNAVEAVVDCFAGQPFASGLSYRIDPGNEAQQSTLDEGFKNADLTLSAAEVLANVQKVQRRQMLPVSKTLNDFQTFTKSNQRTPAQASYTRKALDASNIHLDVEMETGTGKTYCYIKTMFEMNKLYGWSKFIIMVPSIAIREGVFKSLEITADHFTETYGKKARFFIYNSRRLHELESFSSDAGINVMVINIQAFASRGRDNLRIYDELDDFQSRKPIEVIASNRPILILDEPQKMGGDATTNALPEFKPLMILRYSATHRVEHNRVHRLDALDAYNQKLVKKIAVRGIQTRGLPGTNAYLYLEGIDISKQAPVARLEIELQNKTGEIRRQLRRLRAGDNLYELSNNLDQYRDGFVISQIDARTDTVEFTNGLELQAGQASNDLTEHDIRRIQIRETIRTHLEREKQLFDKGIKVLSLFFIDEVAKYRDYDQPDDKGEYARIFEDTYKELVEEYLAELAIDNEAYRAYLKGIDAERTHEGYFSIDKKTNQLKDPVVGARAIESDDVDAYDLILKDKESLLALHGPKDSAEDRAKRMVRFIFSHSALREGWDNPNVFVMCLLKHSDNTISRRQEVGRGLRLCVDQNGDRIDSPAIVHDVNVLTVVASESYADFVKGLQTEIADNLTSRPRQATAAYFAGKLLRTDAGDVEVTENMAKGIEFYLIQSGYVDRMQQIQDLYHEHREADSLAELPDDLKTYAEQVFTLVDSVYSGAQMPDISDGRKPKTNPLNANFEKQEFQELWSRINRKAVYRVEFDSDELIRKCIDAVQSHLRVTRLEYVVRHGTQKDTIGRDELVGGSGFEEEEQSSYSSGNAGSQVSYDLVGKVAEASQLTRATSAAILGGIEAAVFEQFKQNPEHFISEVCRIITEQKASMVIEKLTYDAVTDHFDTKIFTNAQTGNDFSRATDQLRKHVFDYVMADSKTERDFVHDLDKSSDVVVYAKLPKGFHIPTPVGDYNPDWAISFKRGNVKHVYFVAETKGAMSTLALRELEHAKIKSARKFFEAVGQEVTADQVRYDVVDGFGRLMDVVR